MIIIQSKSVFWWITLNVRYIQTFCKTLLLSLVQEHNEARNPFAAASKRQYQVFCEPLQNVARDINLYKMVSLTPHLQKEMLFLFRPFVRLRGFLSFPTIASPNHPILDNAHILYRVFTKRKWGCKWFARKITFRLACNFLTASIFREGIGWGFAPW